MEGRKTKENKEAITKLKEREKGNEAINRNKRRTKKQKKEQR
jgi:hypothetical protein